MNLKFVTLAAVVALMAASIIGAALFAPAAAAQALGTTVRLDHADRSFVTTAAEAGMAEVAMAKVAQQRGASAEVKSFADRMVADHGKANADLSSLAASKGTPVPDKLSAKDAREVARLQKLNGSKFDKEYVHVQVAAHKDAVKLFEKQADKGKDADLKGFAVSTLPTLKDHLAMVNGLSQSLH